MPACVLVVEPRAVGGGDAEEARWAGERVS